MCAATLNAVFVTTLVLYGLLGTILILYYGKYIEPTCSLNFLFYRGGAPYNQPIPWFAHVISFIIILFPALDVLSAGPLNAIVLGNNLLSAFVKNEALKQRRIVKIPFRLVAALPPILVACLVRNLATILQYVGLVGFFINFIFPALINLLSKHRCSKVFEQDGLTYRKKRLLQVTARTPYSGHFSLSIYNYVILAFAFIGLGFCFVYNLIVQFSPSK